eukprot:9087371-Alexandrium_andersonii.AAC.1
MLTQPGLVHGAPRLAAVGATQQNVLGATQSLAIAPQFANAQGQPPIAAPPAAAPWQLPEVQPG